MFLYVKGAFTLEYSPEKCYICTMNPASLPSDTRLPELRLPPAPMRLQAEGGLVRVFDPLRRRFVALTPEEWVRQHFVHFLIHHKGYPAARMANEMAIHVGGMTRRCDTVLLNLQGQPLLVVEYKAPSVSISPATFSQVSAYNSVLRVPWVMVSNGLTHYCAHLDETSGRWQFLDDIPPYAALSHS